MSKNKISEHITRSEAADRLANLSKQLREGAVGIGDGVKMPVAEDVELKAEVKDDEFELELKWKPAKRVSTEPTAIA